MTREQFIQKWLACKWVYDEGTRDMMRDDLDKVTEQQCDYIQQLFTRPQEVLKPLQELYRKENPHPEGRFYIPDATQFFKWIVDKIQPTDETYCKCISRIGVTGTEHGKWTCRSCRKEVKH